MLAAFLLAIIGTANCLNLNLVMESADETDLGAGGRIFGSGINFNTTSLGDIANVVLVASLLGVLYYLAFSGESTSGFSNQRFHRRQREEIPPYYDTEYGSDYNDLDFFLDDDFARRSLIGDFTDQLHLLADAFNKYEVNETTCQLYVACESAHVHLHEKHGKLAKIVHQVMKNIERPENVELYQDDAYLMDILDGFKIGASGQSCSHLRKSCRQPKIFLDQ